MSDEFVKNKEENLEEKEDLKDSTNDIRNKLNTLEDQYKRLLADYQNLQKRTTAEKEDIYKFASQKTLESLLPALDTVDYAKSSLTKETNIDQITKDFNLLLDMFAKCFKEIGVDTIEETGIPFDPFHHEPLQQIPTNELPPHTVMQILKKGYILNKKVVRPAMVSVSVENTNNPK